MQELKRKYDTAARTVKQVMMKVPSIFGAPQPSQVRAGSIPQPVHSRMSHDTVASAFVKVIPAFAYTGNQRKRESRADVRRRLGPERAAIARKAIHNQPATHAVRSRLS